jgi:filamentous hemagglutinin family protein
MRENNTPMRENKTLTGKFVAGLGSRRARTGRVGVRVQRWARRLAALAGAVTASVAAIYPAYAGRVAASNASSETGNANIRVNGIGRGSAQFSTSGSLTEIRTTDRTIINYGRFDISLGQTVRFVQPTDRSRVLNRIESRDPSRLDGRLESNGAVYFVNRAGVIFGPNSVINTGRFIAAAGDISNSDFLAGHDRFSLTAPLRAAGVIEGRDGVALLGSQVVNSGQVASEGGAVTFAAGDSVFIGTRFGRVMVKVETRDGGASATVDGPAVQNTGDVSARRGSITVAAGDFYSAAIRNSGRLSARNVAISGGANGAVEVGGAINARSDTGRGGNVEITGETIDVKGATINASGARGGGEVRIGGDLMGGGTMQRASQTSVDEATTITADALKSGDGGLIVIWSDELTLSGGTLSAVGGARGDGGLIETSSAGKLVLGESVPTARAGVGGDAGLWLIDPYNVIFVPGTTPFIPAVQPVADSQIGIDTVKAALEQGTDVSITTAKGPLATAPDQAGNISFASGAGLSVDLGTSTRTLRLVAASGIFLSEPITAATGSLNLILETGSVLGGVDEPGTRGEPDVVVTANLLLGSGDLTVTGLNSAGGTADFRSSSQIFARNIRLTMDGGVEVQATGLISSANIFSITSDGATAPGLVSGDSLALRSGSGQTSTFSFSNVNMNTLAANVGGDLSYTSAGGSLTVGAVDGLSGLTVAGTTLRVRSGTLTIDAPIQHTTGTTTLLSTGGAGEGMEINAAVTADVLELSGSSITAATALVTANSLALEATRSDTVFTFGNADVDQLANRQAAAPRANDVKLNLVNAGPLEIISGLDVDGAPANGVTVGGTGGDVALSLTAPSITFSAPTLAGGTVVLRAPTVQFSENVTAGGLAVFSRQVSQTAGVVTADQLYILGTATSGNNDIAINTGDNSFGVIAADVSSGLVNTLGIRSTAASLTRVGSVSMDSGNIAGDGILVLRPATLTPTTALTLVTGSLTLEQPVISLSGGVELDATNSTVTINSSLFASAPVSIKARGITQGIGSDINTPHLAIFGGAIAADQPSGVDLREPLNQISAISADFDLGNDGVFTVSSSTAMAVNPFTSGIGSASGVDVELIGVAAFPSLEISAPLLTVSAPLSLVGPGLTKLNGALQLAADVSSRFLVLSGPSVVQSAGGVQAQDLTVNTISGVGGPYQLESATNQISILQARINSGPAGGLSVRSATPLAVATSLLGTSGIIDTGSADVAVRIRADGITVSTPILAAFGDVILHSDSAVNLGSEIETRVLATSGTSLTQLSGSITATGLLVLSTPTATGPFSFTAPNLISTLAVSVNAANGAGGGSPDGVIVFTAAGNTLAVGSVSAGELSADGAIVTGLTGNASGLYVRAGTINFDQPASVSGVIDLDASEINFTGNNTFAATHGILLEGTNRVGQSAGSSISAPRLLVLGNGSTGNFDFGSSANEIDSLAADWDLGNDDRFVVVSSTSMSVSDINLLGAFFSGVDVTGGNTTGAVVLGSFDQLTINAPLTVPNAALLQLGGVGGIAQDGGGAIVTSAKVALAAAGPITLENPGNSFPAFAVTNTSTGATQVTVGSDVSIANITTVLPAQVLTGIVSGGDVTISAPGRVLGVDEVVRAPGRSVVLSAGAINLNGDVTSEYLALVAETGVNQLTGRVVAGRVVVLGDTGVYSLGGGNLIDNFAARLTGAITGAFVVNTNASMAVASVEYPLGSGLFVDGVSAAVGTGTGARFSSAGEALTLLAPINAGTGDVSLFRAGLVTSQLPSAGQAITAGDVLIQGPGISFPETDSLTVGGLLVLGNGIGTPGGGQFRFAGSANSIGTVAASVTLSTTPGAFELVNNANLTIGSVFVSVPNTTINGTGLNITTPGAGSTYQVSVRVNGDLDVNNNVIVDGPGTPGTLMTMGAGIFNPNSATFDVGDGAAEFRIGSVTFQSMTFTGRRLLIDSHDSSFLLAGTRLNADEQRFEAGSATNTASFSFNPNVQFRGRAGGTSSPTRFELVQSDDISTANLPGTSTTGLGTIRTVRIEQIGAGRSISVNSLTPVVVGSNLTVVHTGGLGTITLDGTSGALTPATLLVNAPTTPVSVTGFGVSSVVDPSPFVDITAATIDVTGPIQVGNGGTVSMNLLGTVGGTQAAGGNVTAGKWALRSVGGWDGGFAAVGAINNVGTLAVDSGGPTLLRFNVGTLTIGTVAATPAGGSDLTGIKSTGALELFARSFDFAAPIVVTADALISNGNGPMVLNAPITAQDLLLRPFTSVSQTATGTLDVTGLIVNAGLGSSLANPNNVIPRLAGQKNSAVDGTRTEVVSSVALTVGSITVDAPSGSISATGFNYTSVADSILHLRAPAITLSNSTSAGFGDLFLETTTGDLAINAATSGGGVLIKSAGSVTQTGNLIATELGFIGSPAGSIVLTRTTNQISTIAADITVSPTASFAIASANPTSIGSVTIAGITINGLTIAGMTSPSGVVLSGGGISLDAPVNIPAGDFVLDQTGDVVLNSNVTANRFLIRSTGISQPSGRIITSQLGLLNTNANGSYIVDGANQIGTVAANTPSFNAQHILEVRNGLGFGITVGSIDANSYFGTTLSGFAGGGGGVTGRPALALYADSITTTRQITANGPAVLVARNGDISFGGAVLAITSLQISATGDVGQTAPGVTTPLLAVDAASLDLNLTGNFIDRIAANVRSGLRVRSLNNVTVGTVTGPLGTVAGITVDPGPSSIVNLPPAGVTLIAPSITVSDPISILGPTAPVTLDATTSIALGANVSGFSQLSMRAASMTQTTGVLSGTTVAIISAGNPANVVLNQPNEASELVVAASAGGTFAFTNTIPLTITNATAFAQALTGVTLPQVPGSSIFITGTDVNVNAPVGTTDVFFDLTGQLNLASNVSGVLLHVRSQGVSQTAGGILSTGVRLLSKSAGSGSFSLTRTGNFFRNLGVNVDLAADAVVDVSSSHPGNPFSFPTFAAGLPFGPADGVSTTGGAATAFRLRVRDVVLGSNPINVASRDAALYLSGDLSSTDPAGDISASGLLIQANAVTGFGPSQASITASRLLLIGTGPSTAGYDLSGANAIGRIAADVTLQSGSLEVNSTVPMTVGSVTVDGTTRGGIDAIGLPAGQNALALTGSALTVSGPVNTGPADIFIDVAGNVALAANVDAGTLRIVASSISQSDGRVKVDTLGINSRNNTAGTFDLSFGDNEIANFAARVTTPTTGALFINNRIDTPAGDLRIDSVSAFRTFTNTTGVTVLGSTAIGFQSSGRNLTVAQRINTPGSDTLLIHAGEVDLAADVTARGLLLDTSGVRQTAGTLSVTNLLVAGTGSTFELTGANSVANFAAQVSASATGLLWLNTTGATTVGNVFVGGITLDGILAERSADGVVLRLEGTDLTINSHISTNQDVLLSRSGVVFINHDITTPDTLIINAFGVSQFVNGERVSVGSLALRDVGSGGEDFLLQASGNIIPVLAVSIPNAAVSTKELRVRSSAAVTIGSADGLAGVTITGAGTKYFSLTAPGLTLTDPILLSGNTSDATELRVGAATLQSDITSPFLGIYGSGIAQQSGKLTVDRLLILGNGVTYDLSSTNNQIGTLAADVTTTSGIGLVVNTAGDMTIGAVSQPFGGATTNGVTVRNSTSGSAAFFSSGANLVIEQPINVGPADVAFVRSGKVTSSGPVAGPPIILAGNLLIDSTGAQLGLNDVIDVNGLLVKGTTAGPLAPIGYFLPAPAGTLQRISTLAADVTLPIDDAVQLSVASALPLSVGTVSVATPSGVVSFTGVNVDVPASTSVLKLVISAPSLTVDSPVFVENGDALLISSGLLSLSADVDVTSTLRLQAASLAQTAGRVRAAGVWITSPGTGPFVLGSSTNQIGTLAAIVGGPLTVNTVGDLTIGLVPFDNGRVSLAGVTVTGVPAGTVAFTSSGANLRIEEALNVGGADAVLLRNGTVTLDLTTSDPSSFSVIAGNLRIDSSGISQADSPIDVDGLQVSSTAAGVFQLTSPLNQIGVFAADVTVPSTGVFAVTNSGDSTIGTVTVGGRTLSGVTVRGATAGNPGFVGIGGGLLVDQPLDTGDGDIILDRTGLITDGVVFDFGALDLDPRIITSGQLSVRAPEVRFFSPVIADRLFVITPGGGGPISADVDDRFFYFGLNSLIGTLAADIAVPGRAVLGYFTAPGWTTSIGTLSAFERTVDGVTMNITGGGLELLAGSIDVNRPITIEEGSALLGTLDETGRTRIDAPITLRGSTAPFQNGILMLAGDSEQRIGAITASGLIVIQARSTFLPNPANRIGILAANDISGDFTLVNDFNTLSIGALGVPQLFLTSLLPIPDTTGITAGSNAIVRLIGGPLNIDAPITLGISNSALRLDRAGFVGINANLVVAGNISLRSAGAVQTKGTIFAEQFAVTGDSSVLDGGNDSGGGDPSLRGSNGPDEVLDPPGFLFLSPTNQVLDFAADVTVGPTGSLALRTIDTMTINVFDAFTYALQPTLPLQPLDAPPGFDITETALSINGVKVTGADPGTPAFTAFGDALIVYAPINVLSGDTALLRNGPVSLLADVNTQRLHIASTRLTQDNSTTLVTDALLLTGTGTNYLLTSPTNQIGLLAANLSVVPTGTLRVVTQTNAPAGDMVIGDVLVNNFEGSAAFSGVTVLGTARDRIAFSTTGANLTVNSPINVFDADAALRRNGQITFNADVSARRLLLDSTGVNQVGGTFNAEELLVIGTSTGSYLFPNNNTIQRLAANVTVGATGQLLVNTTSTLTITTVTVDSVTRSGVTVLGTALPNVGFSTSGPDLIVLQPVRTNNGGIDFLRTGAVTLNADVTSSGLLRLTATGVQQTAGSVDVGSAVFRSTPGSSGAFSFPSSTNSVDNLAAALTGPLLLNTLDNVNITTVDGITGLTVSGQSAGSLALQLLGTGSVTVNAPVTTNPANLLIDRGGQVTGFGLVSTTGLATFRAPSVNLPNVNFGTLAVVSAPATSGSFLFGGSVTNLAANVSVSGPGTLSILTPGNPTTIVPSLSTPVGAVSGVTVLGGTPTLPGFVSTGSAFTVASGAFLNAPNSGIQLDRTGIVTVNGNISAPLGQFTTRILGPSGTVFQTGPGVGVSAASVLLLGNGTFNLDSLAGSPSANNIPNLATSITGGLLLRSNLAISSASLTSPLGSATGINVAGPTPLVVLTSPGLTLTPNNPLTALGGNVILRQTGNVQLNSPLNVLGGNIALIGSFPAFAQSPEGIISATDLAIIGNGQTLNIALTADNLVSGLAADIIGSLVFRTADGQSLALRSVSFTGDAPVGTPNLSVAGAGLIDISSGNRLDILTNVLGNNVKLTSRGQGIFGPANPPSVSVNADILTLEALFESANPALRGQVSQLQNVVFRGTAGGATSPITMSVRQAADLNPAPQNFGNPAQGPLFYLLESTQGSVTIGSAANVSRSNLTLIGNQGVIVSAPMSLNSLSVPVPATPGANPFIRFESFPGSGATGIPHVATTVFRNDDPLAGSQNYAVPVLLATGTRLTAALDITLLSTVNSVGSPQAMFIDADRLLTIAGNIGASSPLLSFTSTSGRTALQANVTTTQFQSFALTTVSNNPVLTGTTITFTDALDDVPAGSDLTIFGNAFFTTLDLRNLTVNGDATGQSAFTDIDFRVTGAATFDDVTARTGSIFAGLADIDAATAALQIVAGNVQIGTASAGTDITVFGGGIISRVLTARDIRFGFGTEPSLFQPAAGIVPAGDARIDRIDTARSLATARNLTLGPASVQTFVNVGDNLTLTGNLTAGTLFVANNATGLPFGITTTSGTQSFGGSASLAFISSASTVTTGLDANVNTLTAAGDVLVGRDLTSDIVRTSGGVSVAATATVTTLIASNDFTATTANVSNLLDARNITAVNATIGSAVADLDINIAVNANIGSATARNATVGGNADIGTASLSGNLTVGDNLTLQLGNIAGDVDVTNLATITSLSANSLRAGSANVGLANIVLDINILGSGTFGTASARNANFGLDADIGSLALTGSLTVGRNLTLGTASVAQDISVAQSGSIANLLTARNVRIGLDLDIAQGNLTGDLDIGQDLRFGTLVVGNNVTVGRSAFGTNLAAGGIVSVASLLDIDGRISAASIIATTADINTASATGSILVSGNATINHVLAAGDVFVGTNATLGTVTSATSLTVGNDLTLDTGSFTGDVSVARNATGTGLDAAGSVDIGGTATFTRILAGGIFSAASASVTDRLEAAAITAGRLDVGTAAATGDISVTGTGSSIIQYVERAQNLFFAGDAILPSVTPAPLTPAVNLTVLGQLDLGIANLSGDLRVTGDSRIATVARVNNLVAQGVVTFIGSNPSVQAQGTMLFQDDVVFGDGDLTLDAPGTITFNQTASFGRGTTRITAGDDLTFRGPVSGTATSLELSSTSGDLRLDDNVSLTRSAGVGGNLTLRIAAPGTISTADNVASRILLGAADGSNLTLGGNLVLGFNSPVGSTNVSVSPTIVFAPDLTDALATLPSSSVTASTITVDFGHRILSLGNLTLRTSPRDGRLVIGDTTVRGELLLDARTISVLRRTRSVVLAPPRDAATPGNVIRPEPGGSDIVAARVILAPQTRITLDGISIAPEKVQGDLRLAVPDFRINGSGGASVRILGYPVNSTTTELVNGVRVLNLATVKSASGQFFDLVASGTERGQLATNEPGVDDRFNNPNAGILPIDLGVEVVSLDPRLSFDGATLDKLKRYLGIDLRGAFSPSGLAEAALQGYRSYNLGTYANEVQGQFASDPSKLKFAIDVESARVAVAVLDSFLDPASVNSNYVNQLAELLRGYSGAVPAADRAPVSFSTYVRDNATAEQQAALSQIRRLIAAIDLLNLPDPASAQRNALAAIVQQLGDIGMSSDEAIGLLASSLGDGSVSTQQALRLALGR